jgi:hypothetical protein
MGAYQLLLQEGMPARAAVYETVALLQRDQAFVNAVKDKRFPVNEMHAW